MFTGIVEELGILQTVKKDAINLELTIKAEKILQEIGLGDSIAVNGICLTVTGFSKNNFTVDVMPETFRKTSLAQVQIGSRVNLERALTLQSRLGGHLVSGHIDGVGIIKSKIREKNALIITITAPEQILKYIIPKGSIAIDGISLTIVDHNKDSFWVSLIPHTASLTTLGWKKEGEMVNLEADMIARYLEKLVYPVEKKKEISSDFLRENGFL